MRPAIMLILLSISFIFACSGDFTGKDCGSFTIAYPASENTQEQIIEKGKVDKCYLEALKTCKIAHSEHQLLHADGVVEKGYRQVKGIEGDRCISEQRALSFENLDEDNPRYDFYMEKLGGDEECGAFDQASGSYIASCEFDSRMICDWMRTS